MIFTEYKRETSKLGLLHICAAAFLYGVIIFWCIFYKTRITRLINKNTKDFFHNGSFPKKRQDYFLPLVDQGIRQPESYDNNIICIFYIYILSKNILFVNSLDCLITKKRLSNYILLYAYFIQRNTFCFANKCHYIINDTCFNKKNHLTFWVG